MHSLRLPLSVLLRGRPTPLTRRVKVVTSLTTYGAIAREIVGDQGTVTSIAQGDEDPHFVQPKPSFVTVLRDADLFVTTGMDLELWVPALLDRAGNRKIIEGAPGYVAAYAGSICWRFPPRLSRRAATSMWTATRTSTPIRSTESSSPATSSPASSGSRPPARPTLRPGAGFREAGARGHHGAEAGPASHPTTAYELLRTDKLQDFLGQTEIPGQAAARSARWLAQDRRRSFRGKEMACYHKEWAYFSQRFKIDCVDLHRGQARHPSHAEARAGSDRAHAAAEDTGAVCLELFRPEADRARGRADRGPGGDRAGKHRRRAGREHLLRSGEYLGEQPGRRISRRGLKTGAS